MPQNPAIIDFHAYRTRHLLQKYSEHLKEHLGHFEQNLIGFSYSLDDEFLRHRITVDDLSFTVIELDGELICLAELKFGKERFTRHEVIEWLERHDVHFQPENCQDNTLLKASRILTGVRFRDTCIVIYRKGTRLISFDSETFEHVSSEIDSYTDVFLDCEVSPYELGCD